MTSSAIRPRKRASQARSRMTVDCIVEATARLLVRDGYDRTSTNRIAQEAGVSIGSLYQYFPSKEALVAAVAAHHMEEVEAVLHAAFAETLGDAAAVVVRRVVAAMIVAHSINPALHRVLAEQLPRLDAEDPRYRMEGRFQETVRAFLAAQYPERAATDIDIAAFLCVTLVESATHGAVLHRPDLLEAWSTEALTDHICTMILRYLA